MGHDNSHNQNIPTSSHDLPILGPIGALILGLTVFILFLFAGPHLGIRETRVATAPSASCTQPTAGYPPSFGDRRVI
jgi:hypothetical protein